MALLTGPKCGQEVSNDAASCPECGNSLGAPDGRAWGCISCSCSHPFSLFLRTFWLVEVEFLAFAFAMGARRLDGVHVTILREPVDEVIPALVGASGIDRNRVRAARILEIGRTGVEGEVSGAAAHALCSRVYGWLVLLGHKRRRTM